MVLASSGTLGISNRLRVSTAGAVSVPGTLESASLAGTGTRLVTSTTAGLFGNATTIAGANTWSDVQTFSSTIVGNISGNAATVTTNANLTGPITSVGNVTSVASQTGTGSTFAMSVSPAFTGTVTGVNSSWSGTLNVTGIGTFLNDVTVAGNLGIKDTSPIFDIDVAGDIRIQGENFLYFGGTGADDWGASLQYTETGEGGNYLTISADSVEITFELDVPTINAEFLNLETQAIFGFLSGTGNRLVGSSAAGQIFNPTTVDGAYTWAGAQTYSSAPIFSTTTASRLLAINGSKAAVSVSDLTSWIAGTANQITSTSDGDGTLTLSLPGAITFPGTATATTSISTPALTVSGLSSGRIPLVSTAGLFSQGDFYWNSTGLGIGSAASTPAVPLHVTTAFSTGAEMIRLQTASGVGAVGDYLSINARHWMDTGGSTIAGASVRFTSVNPDTGVRDSKVGLYGSNNEVQTLGLEVAPDGAVTMPVTLGVTGAATLSSTLAVTGGSTLTGDVGVGGANADAYKLEVTSGTDYKQFRIKSTGASGEPLMKLSGAYNSGNGAEIWQNASGTLTLSTNSGTAVIQSTAAGVVTIPGSLVVTGATTFTGGIAFNGGGTNLNYHLTGTFTMGVTGFTTSPTGTASYTRIGDKVALVIPAISGTSNSTGFTLTGIPAAIRPTTATMVGGLYYVDNGTTCYGFIKILTDGTAECYKNQSTVWTNSGNKQITGDASTQTIHYTVK
jgi:hypothetical protein